MLRARRDEVGGKGNTIDVSEDAGVQVLSAKVRGSEVGVEKPADWLVCVVMDANSKRRFTIETRGSLGDSEVDERDQKIRRQVGRG